MKTTSEDNEFYASDVSLGRPGAVQVVLPGEKKDEDQTRNRCTNERGTIRSFSPNKESADRDENENNVVVYPSCSLLLQQRGNSHEKRRSLGRSARRRRRKFLDVQQREEEIIRKQQYENAGGEKCTVGGTLEETSLTKKESSNAGSSSSIPVDRDKVWPAVAERRRQFTADRHEASDSMGVVGDGGWRVPADERLLIGQLGFLPGNAIRVSTRVKDLFLRKQGQDQERDEGDYCQSMERLFLRSNMSNKGNDYGNIVFDNDDGQVPVVLQLYPLVYRDEYTGGKADGRKVAKGRKRLVRKSTSTSVVADNNDDDEGKDTSNSQTGVAGKNDVADTVVVEPFPTIYWLTHPLLRAWISQLELDGLGVRLEQRLAAPGNEALLERMQRAHEAYALEREQLLTPADVALVHARHWDDALLMKSTRMTTATTTSNHPIRGVAGVRNFKAVKCLHAHAAHYLSVGSMGSRDNVVGEWVMQEVHKMLKERSRRENGEA